MKKYLFLVLIFISALSFAQQQLLIKGVQPNFYVIHNVSSNETYASIATLYNITAAQIANYNNLTLHNDKVFARTLQIPLTNKNFIQKPTASRTEIFVPVNYILNVNEKLADVAARFKVPVQSLKQMNNIGDEKVNTTKQFIIGFLRTKPEAASFFGIVRKIV